MARPSKSKAKRKTSAWYQRHVQDPHVRRAVREGKRSRAAFKLLEILDRHGLNLRTGNVVVDLGCAPGSWCMELVKRVGRAGCVIGMDLLPVAPIDGVTLIQADFTTDEGRALLKQALSGREIDVVVSDMAPEMSGNKLVDQMRMIGLNELTLEFACRHLRTGGHLLMKTFMGEGYDQLRAMLAAHFERVRHIKPAASRKSSAEFFLLANGLRR